MSFGGSVSAMILSLKNNSRAKRKTYFDKKGSSSKKPVIKPEYDFPKVSATELERIKEAIRAKAKEDRKKQGLYLILGVIGVIIVFLIFNY